MVLVGNAFRRTLVTFEVFVLTLTWVLIILSLTVTQRLSFEYFRRNYPPRTVSVRKFPGIGHLTVEEQQIEGNPAESDNLASDCQDFLKSRWICLDFSFQNPKNIKCCCFWGFQTKLAASGSCCVKFLRKWTLGDEDTPD